jgi:hypothetical protein
MFYAYRRINKDSDELKEIVEANEDLIYMRHNLFVFMHDDTSIYKLWKDEDGEIRRDLVVGEVLDTAHVNTKTGEVYYANRDGTYTVPFDEFLTGETVDAHVDLLNEVVIFNRGKENELITHLKFLDQE